VFGIDEIAVQLKFVHASEFTL